VARFFYTQQIRVVFNTMSLDGIGGGGLLIIAVNACLVLGLFFVIFRKNRLNG